MNKGDTVIVLAHGGVKLRRRIVEDKGDVVLLCSDDEFLEAEKIGRVPSCIGFPSKDIINVTAKVKKK